ncbi:MAG: hypothetical protein WC806_02120 [Candidatus Gracilibacteria bacterium]
MKYRATYSKSCSCRTEHKPNVQEFVAEGDAEAIDIAKGYVANRNEEIKGREGFRYYIAELRRIDVEEQSTKLDVNADHAKSAE